MNNKFYVPISEKVLLTVEKAECYSNIGINKISDLLNNPLCEFVLYVGKKDWLKEKNLKNI